jgi:two-component system, LytTR family, response regulator LytT
VDSEIRILIIEDEALIAQKIKMQLESFGYQIAGVFYNFEAATPAIQELDFDVLITDINLGDGIDTKSGIVLAQQLKEIKECPIIFLTAFSDKDTIKKATTVSPSAYLVKPVNEANLFAAVQLAVENFTSNQSKESEEESTPDYFFVKMGKKYIKIFWKDVYYMQAIKNYVKICTREQTSGVLVAGSLQQVLQNMIPESLQNRFIKINRAEAIAKEIVTQVSDDEVVTPYGTFSVSGGFNKKDLGL